MLKEVLEKWIRSCVRHNKISRNTVAVGLVILDSLLEKCPLEKADIVSEGGEITGARSGLRNVLKKHGIPETYLKEATTRQVHQDGQRLLDALRYGKVLSSLSNEKRMTELTRGIAVLKKYAQEWLARQNLKIDFERHQSPAHWIQSILNEARGRSGGKVEQHLVGAKLENRHPDIKIENYPGHAGDVQTGRAGDFAVGSTCYHVTASPGRDVIEKCVKNHKNGLHPVLLVPSEHVSKAKHLAEDQGEDDQITIVAIEDFLAMNIIEMSKGKRENFIDTLRKIIDSYNRRLGAVETDVSLKIDLP